jgi:hypothetical protein
LCAAHFFLELVDDDLLHFITPSTATFFYGACRLPWNNAVDTDNLYAVPEPIRYSLVYENENMSYCDFIMDESNDCPLCSKVDGEPAYFTMCNIQQILFSLFDGRIAPRNMSTSWVVNESDVQGIDDETLKSAANIMNAMENNHVNTYFDIIENSENNKDFIDTAELTIDDLVNENKKLQAELKEMKAVYKKEKHTSSNFGRELEKQREVFNCEHDELVSLREAIFNFQQEESDEIPESNITFPYKTQGKICVVGGSIPWLKSIKPLLPNIRFISTETAPNQDIIKNADVVWIQVNSLPHGYFYGIINIVRANKIPLKYFGYSGVQKCAEQLVSEGENAKIVSKV